MNLRFSVPEPPSLNNIYVTRIRKGKAYRHKAPEYTKWIDVAGWSIRRAQSEWDSGQWDIAKRIKDGLKYELVLEVHANMRGDIDNRLKAASDLLKEMSVITDDRHAVRCEVRRASDVDKGWARIYLYPVAQMAEAAE